MTTYDLPETLDAASIRQRGLVTSVTLAVEAALRRRQERHLIAELSRRVPRLLDDMGLDPQAIYDAAEGTWDVLPASRRLPRV